MAMYMLSSFVIFVGVATALPQNPCPNVFQYESSGGNEIHGILRFRNDLSGNYKVELKMVIPVRTNQNIGIKRLSSVQDAQSGRDVVFGVSFPGVSQIPEVDEIIFNGRLLCSMPHSLGPQFPALTFLSAFHMFSVTIQTLPQRPHQMYQPVPETHIYRPSESPPSTPHGAEFFESLFTQMKKKPETVVPFTNPITQSPQVVTKRPEPLGNRIDSECGMAEDTQALVIHGTVTSEGQYPWLVAMFHLQETEKYQFRCAANLVTNSHVITAAHCVRNAKKPENLPIENIILVLGKHNIKKWATRSEIRDVKTIYVHPDYQQPSDADIAILLMYKSVEYTIKIRPVCLWDDDAVTITGKQGVAIGWGRDEFFNDHVPEPKEVSMPVVSQEDCLRSDERFVKLTSERTFCAGFRNGSGVCTGDSGGGFVMKHHGRWTLRGIISAALIDPSTRSCDVHKYMVFSDVVKYRRWIDRVLDR